MRAAFLGDVGVVVGVGVGVGVGVDGGAGACGVFAGVAAVEGGHDTRG